MQKVWTRLSLNEAQYRRAQYLRMKLEGQVAEYDRTVRAIFNSSRSQFCKEFVARFVEFKRHLGEFQPHAMSVRVAAEALRQLRRDAKQLRLAATFAAYMSH